MAYATADARQRLLDAIAEAIEHIGCGLACLGEAYEQLDDQTADELEQELFRPVQMAYGRAKRIHAEFAGHHGLPGGIVEPTPPRARSRGVKGFLESALDAVSKADGVLAALQDSMLPVEVGDPQLRASLAEVRTLLGDLRGRARELLRTLGR